MYISAGFCRFYTAFFNYFKMIFIFLFELNDSNMILGYVSILNYFNKLISSGAGKRSETKVTIWMHLSAAKMKA